MSTEERGRFKIVRDRREMALPSCDFITGEDRAEFYVDLDRDTDEGRIYISKHTAEEIAKLIGWVPSDLNETDKLELQLLRKDCADLRSRLYSIVDALRGVGDFTDSSDEGVSGGNTVSPKLPAEQPVKSGKASKRLDGPAHESEFD